MNKLILILLLISTPVMVIKSSPLEEYFWKNRVIVTFSPSKNNTDRSLFLNSIHENLCEFITIINNGKIILVGISVFNNL